jgi:hypothetical protein
MKIEDKINMILAYLIVLLGASMIGIGTYHRLLDKALAGVFIDVIGLVLIYRLNKENR